MSSHPCAYRVMTSKPTSLATAIYSLRVELTRIEPLIWRRLLVRGSTTLVGLHAALQVTMGWTNSHLHSFTFGDVRYGVPDEIYGPTMRDERGQTLAKVLGETHREFGYTYDFGDDWEHRIVVEALSKARAEFHYPICVAGERACPPEDVGGPPGYQDFLEALLDASHPKHSQYLRWIGGVFDPEGCDINAVNRALAKLRR